MDRNEILCKEYDAVRGEIVTGLSNRVRILSVGITAVGLIWAAAASQYGSHPGFASLVLVGAVPLMALPILWIWFGEYERVQKAGIWQSYLEGRIKVQSQKDPKIEETVLTWETWQRKRRDDEQKERKLKWRPDPAITLLCTIVVLSVVLGSIIALLSQMEAIGRTAVCVAAIAWLGVTAAVYRNFVSIACRRRVMMPQEYGLP